MISHQTKGSGFGGLQRYLFAGKSGSAINDDRVAYVESLNMGTSGPYAAARLMKATAFHNPRVTRPVLHLSINPPPEAKLSRTELRRVALSTLEAVGLSEHQALLVIHHDLDRQHIHLMVNRVHPETLKAWKRNYDYKLINQALDRESVRLGLRLVNRESTGLSKSAYWRALKSEQEPFTDFLRPWVEAAIVEASSWDELTAGLAKSSKVWLAPRGAGAVVTDGRENAKLSSLSTLGGVRKFEEAFGEGFREYLARAGELQVGRGKGLFERSPQRRSSDLGDAEKQVPKILGQILEHKAVFTEADVKRHAFWRAGGKNLTDLVLGSEEVVSLGVETLRDPREGIDRIVGEREIYTTREMWGLEERFRDQVQVLVKAEAGERVALAPDAGSELSGEQRQAVSQLLANGRLGLLTGHAGTGKGWVQRELRAAYEGAGFRVRGMAVSGIAAAQLRSEGIEARTITSYQYRWSQGEMRLTSKDVVLLDEASMVDTRQMVAVLDEVVASGARLVVTGDTNQLSPVGPGAPYRWLLKIAGPELSAGVATLQTVHRQDVAWQRDAAFGLLAGESRGALEAYRDHGNLRFAVRHDQLLEQVVRDVTARALKSPEASQLVLAVRNVDVDALNRGIRYQRKAAGHLGEASTTIGDQAFAVGERVVFLENDPAGGKVRSLPPRPGEDVGVQRGDFGTLTAIEADGHVQVALDAGRTVRFSPEVYNKVALGYAATVHRAQGVSIDYTYYVPSGAVSRDAAYTAFSRQRKDLTLYLSKELWLPKEKSLVDVDGGRSIDEPDPAEVFASSEERQAMARLGWFMGREELVEDIAHHRAEVNAREALEATSSATSEGAELGPRPAPIDARDLEKVEALKEAIASSQAVFSVPDVERLRLNADLSREQTAHLFALEDVVALRDDPLDGTLYTTKSYLEAEGELFGRVERLQESERIRVLAGSRSERLERVHDLVADATARGGAVQVLAHSRRDVDRLSSEESLPARTLAADAANPRPADLVVIENASKLSTEDLRSALERVEDRGASVVLAGDVAGARPFGAGEPFAALVEDAAITERLEAARPTWMRAERQAFEAIRDGRPEQAVESWQRSGRFEWSASREQALSEIASQVAANLAIRGRADAIALTYTRADAESLNREIRSQLIARGKVERGGVEIGGREYSAGDRVVFRHTLSGSAGDLETLTGDRTSVGSGAIAKLDSVHQGRFEVSLDDGSRIAFTPRAGVVEHAYASTVVRAPEVEQAHLLLERHTERTTLLEGLSTHSGRIQVHADRDTFTSPAHLAAQLEGRLPRDLARDHIVLAEARATYEGLRRDPSPERSLETLARETTPGRALSYDEHLVRIVESRKLAEDLRGHLQVAYADPVRAERMLALEASEHGIRPVATALRDTPTRYGELALDRPVAIAAAGKAAGALEALERTSPRDVFWQSLRQGTVEKPGLLRQASIAARGAHLAFHKLRSAYSVLKASRNQSAQDTIKTLVRQGVRTTAWSLVAKAMPATVYAPIAITRTAISIAKRIRDMDRSSGMSR